MEHKGTKTIETNRLLLRKFCAEDTNAAFDGAKQDMEFIWEQIKTE